MPKVVITAEVEDLERWEEGFRTHGDLFREMAVSSLAFGTAEGNRIVVCGETTNLEAYLKVFNSPATAAAMTGDGVKRATVKLFILDKEVKV